jgi:hypothetical protein
MNKFKNKKRLIGLAVAFAMIFAVGTAFALTTQTLDIQGTITIAAETPEMDVYWSDVEPAPQFAPLFNYNFGNVENVAEVDAADDTLITWDLKFIGDAGNGLQATIIATARNRGADPVIITDVNVEFDATLAEFEFDYIIGDVDVPFVSNTPLLPNATRDVAVGIDWFGETPDNFVIVENPYGYYEVTVGGVTITFDVEPYIG